MGKDLRGKELGEGFTQRESGKYQARYVDRFGQRKTITNDSLQELRKQYAKLVTENLGYASIRENLNLDDWFNRWMNIYKIKSIKPNTEREYTHIYKKSISPYLGNRLIKTITKSDIQELVDRAFDDHYMYERQSKIKIICKDIFQRALEDDLIYKNPVSGIKLRSDKEVKARSLTLEEQNTFMDYAFSSMYYNLYQVALNTGLRPGELFGLYVSDIDFDTGMISVTKTLVYQKYLTDTRKEFHIESPKTKQSIRKVPMNSVCREYMLRQVELKKMLSEKRPKQQNDYLFVTKFNTPLNSQIYSDSINAVVKQINLTRSFDNQFQKFSGHTLRHTFATRCFEAGVEPKTIQKYLGHATIKMTMDLYVHVTDEKANEDIEKIVKESNIISLKIS